MAPSIYTREQNKNQENLKIVPSTSHPHVMLHCYDLGLGCMSGLIILPSPFKPPCPQGEGLLF